MTLVQERPWIEITRFEIESKEGLEFLIDYETREGIDPDDIDNPEYEDVLNEVEPFTTSTDEYEIRQTYYADWSDDELMRATLTTSGGKSYVHCYEGGEEIDCDGSEEDDSDEDDGSGNGEGSDSAGILSVSLFVVFAMICSLIA